MPTTSRSTDKETGNYRNVCIELSNNNNITLKFEACTSIESFVKMSTEVDPFSNFSSKTQIDDYYEQQQKNVSSIFAELNITKEIWNEFLRKYLTQYNERKRNSSFREHIEECSEYCNGNIRDVLLSYREVHGYIALLTCIFGTIGNIINIIVLTKKDMIKAPINKILKWLAVADVFVMIEYIPFATYMYIFSSPGKQDFRYYWAVYLIFHMHFTQILHTISIGLTVALAIWRYVAIIHSNESCSHYMLSHSNETIILPFIISPILCLPTLFVFTIKERHFPGSASESGIAEVVYHVDAEGSTSLYRFNFWIHSVIIKLLPCFILTIISLRLIRVLCNASKRRHRLKNYNNLTINSGVAMGTSPKSNEHRPVKFDRRSDRTTLLLVAVLMLFLITEFPQGILGLLSGILQKCFFVRCYGLFGELMDMLALINGAIGFVLYGLMSKQFRTSFKLLFFEQKLDVIELTRVTRVATTCV